MSNIIAINKQNLTIREFKGERVITFSDIDRVHGRPETTARQNFKRNESRFVRGVDYLVCKTYEAKEEFGITAPNGLILITESGYLMLVKSFNDDLAWTVQRQLVNSYFRKTNLPATAQAMPGTVYEYIEKTFRGEPVVTLQDIAHFVKVSRDMIYYHFSINRKKLAKNKDYYYLQYAELSEYKRENPKTSQIIKHMLLFTQSGVMKLSKFLGIKGNELIKSTFQAPAKKPERVYSKHYDIDMQMKLRYVRITEAELILAAMRNVRDPFRRSFLGEYVTSILIDEEVWTDKHNGFNGVSSDFSLNTLEGCNKSAAMDKARRLMESEIPINSDNMLRKFAVSGLTERLCDRRAVGEEKTM